MILVRVVYVDVLFLSFILFLVLPSYRNQSIDLLCNFYFAIFSFTCFLETVILSILLVYSAAWKNLFCQSFCWIYDDIESYFLWFPMHYIDLIYMEVGDTNRFNKFYTKLLTVFIFVVWDTWNFDHPRWVHVFAKKT